MGLTNTAAGNGRLPHHLQPHRLPKCVFMGNASLSLQSQMGMESQGPRLRYIIVSTSQMEAVSFSLTMKPL